MNYADISQIDRAFCSLSITWNRCQHQHPTIRRQGQNALKKALSRVRAEALKLPEYRSALNGATCHWSIRREDCYLVVLIRFIDRPLPSGLRDLRLLKAIGAIVLCNLGIQQTELVGEDWKGLRVMHDNGGWIGEEIR